MSERAYRKAKEILRKTEVEEKELYVEVRSAHISGSLLFFFFLLFSRGGGKILNVDSWDRILSGVLSLAQKMKFAYRATFGTRPPFATLRSCWISRHRRVALRKAPALFYSSRPEKKKLSPKFIRLVDAHPSSDRCVPRMIRLKSSYTSIYNQSSITSLQTDKQRLSFSFKINNRKKKERTMLRYILPNAARCAQESVIRSNCAYRSFFFFFFLTLPPAFPERERPGAPSKYYLP